MYTDFKNYLHNYDLKKIYQANNFLVKDAGFNTIYAQNLEAMAEICLLVGDPSASHYQMLASTVTQSILNIMYDEEDEAFYDVQGKSNKKLKVLTPTVFFPAIIKGAPATFQREEKSFTSRQMHFLFPLPEE